MNCSVDAKTASLYCKLSSFKRLLNQTNDFIKNSINNITNPYLACSFGKDSSVMLDLVLKHIPDIKVRFATHPETRLLDNYDEIIGYWKNKNINYEEIYCAGGLVKVKHHQRESLNQGEWDSFFIGIRAEESFGRRVSLKKYGAFYKLKNGRIKISPVAWWKTIDISSYILDNNIPYLNKYSKEGFGARTTSGVPRTHVSECLSSLKSRDINSFNKLCRMFPDVKEFV